MQKAIIILFSLYVFSCAHLRDSKGDYNEVLILSSYLDKTISFKYIENIFSESIHTPSDEFKNYLKYRNVIFLSISEPKDSTIDILVDNFKYSYKENIFMLNDVYAKNQALLFLSFQDSIDMINKLSDNKEWIISSIDENISKNMNSYMYRNGENFELKKQIDDYYKVDSKIQKDYMVVKDRFLDEAFLWIGRGYPY